MKLNNMLHDWRIILMLILVGLAIVAIHPVPWHEGAAIRSVVSNSSASDAGFVAPKPTSTPTSRERILQIDSNPIKTITDYENAIKTLSPDQTIQIETDRDSTPCTPDTKWSSQQDCELHKDNRHRKETQRHTDQCDHHPKCDGSTRSACRRHRT